MPKILSPRIGLRIAIGLCAVLVIVLGIQRQKATTVPPSTITVDGLDIGMVREHDVVPITLTVHNSGTETVEIEEIRTTCNCMKVDFPKQIHPGDTQRVQVQVTVRPLTQAERSAGGRFTGELYPKIKGSHVSLRGVQWRVTGNIQPLLASVSTSKIDFGLIVHGTPPVPQKLDAQVAQGLVPVQVEGDELATFETRCEVHQQHVSILVTPRSLPVGVYDKYLKIHARDIISKRVSVVSIPVRFEIVEDFFAVPSSINLGIRTLGRSVDAEIVIRSRTGIGFSISNTRGSQGWLKVQTAAQAEDGTTTIPITIRVAEVSEQTGFVEIDITESLSKNRRTLQVPVSYFGIHE
jgi:Protein of unknown function (DUF1573)